MHPWLTSNKLLAIVFGAVVAVLTLEAQTPENLTSYLLEQGYQDIVVAPLASRCGKSKSAYKFTGRWADGRRVSGNVCMGGFKFLYAINVDV